MRKSLYTQNAGKTSIQGVPSDHYGNAKGSKWDLARNRAFKGYSIVVLQLIRESYAVDEYVGFPRFDFKKPSKALKKKGFKVIRFVEIPPSPNELEVILTKASQLWIISGNTKKLNSHHLAVIQKFHESGRGLFIWGDNPPWIADANFILKEMFSTRLSGNYEGEQILSEATESSIVGFRAHLITTGINQLYEGSTISSVKLHSSLERVITSSDGKCVTACYDNGNSRAIIDGGFTRLYNKWDNAGTARFVVNCAAWLVNLERNEAGIQEEEKKEIIAADMRNIVGFAKKSVNKLTKTITELFKSMKKKFKK